MSKKKNDNNVAVRIEHDHTKTEKEQISDLLLSGSLNGANITAIYNPLSQIDTTDILTSLCKKTRKIKEGSTKDLESLLVSQAVSLDAIFTKLSLRAYSNFGEYLNAGETYLRLALKAQSQCRATIETLAEIKNPRPYIQNNRAEYQQVNNGAVPNSKSNMRSHTHAEKTFSTNELLEDKTHEQEWMDTRTPKEAIRGD